MSLSILDRGEGRYDLYRGDDSIGWIEDRAIGFRGYENRTAARRAATIAYDALSAWLARERHAEATPRGGRTLRVWRDGDVHRLTLGEIPVGRLLTADYDGGPGSAGGSAFELILPPRLGSTLSAAQVAYHALDRRRALGAFELVGAGD
jgi:hypothetical protein